LTESDRRDKLKNRKTAARRLRTPLHASCSGYCLLWSEKWIRRAWSFLIRRVVKQSHRVR